MTAMSSSLDKRTTVTVQCPECDKPVSKKNILRHWKRHVSDVLSGQSTQVARGPPPTQQQRSTLASLPVDELVEGNKMSATPSVSSSIISTTAQTIQYTAAARALLKRTESYTEEGLAAFLAERYPEVEEEHRHSLLSLIHI